eukprot:502720_1
MRISSLYGTLIQKLVKIFATILNPNWSRYTIHMANQTMKKVLLEIIQHANFLVARDLTHPLELIGFLQLCRPFLAMSLISTRQKEISRLQKSNSFQRRQVGAINMLRF